MSMNIELYEYGLDTNLKEAEKILLAALESKDKWVKDLKMSEVLGIIEGTRRMFMVIFDNEETKDETG